MQSVYEIGGLLLAHSQGEGPCSRSCASGRWWLPGTVILQYGVGDGGQCDGVEVLCPLHILTPLLSVLRILGIPKKTLEIIITVLTWNLRNF